MKGDINESKLRKNLVSIYESFIKNPEDTNVHKEAIRYDRAYGSLEGYDSISKEIKGAISMLSFLNQFGSHNDDSELSKEKILGKAKKILEELRKSE
jgi:flagellin-specific chaperone FliS